ncbi:MAG: hypothetical protein Kow0090_22660 [Myxococcota bacterium]
MKRTVYGIVVLAIFYSTTGAYSQMAPQRPAPPAAPPVGGQGGEADFGKEQDISATLDDRVKVVKHKYFLKDGRFELTPLIGASMNDPFKKRYPVGAHIIYHIGENFAAGLTGLYNMNVKSDDVTIIRKSGAAPNVTDLKYNLHLDFYFSPIYGKMAIMSDVIVNFDMFLVGGIGVMGADIPDETNMRLLASSPLASGSGMPVAGNVGLGARLFLTKWLSLNLEVRDYIYSMRMTNLTGDGISDIQNLIITFVGAGFYLPTSFEYSH